LKTKSARKLGMPRVFKVRYFVEKVGDNSE